MIHIKRKATSPTETLDSMVYVSKTGSDTNTGSLTDPLLTVAAALASITDNDSAHRYCITMGPGVYTEANPLEMKAYVNIIGAGGQTVTKIVATTSDADIFKCASYAALSNMELEGATAAAAIHCDVAGSTYHQDITVINCQTGLKISHVDAAIGMYNLNFLTHTGGTIADGVLVENGSADIRNAYVIEDSEVTSLIKTTGSGSSVHAIGAKTESTNVTNGLFADQSSKITINSSEINHCTNAARAENSGYIAARNCMLYDSSAYDVYLTNGGEYGGHASCLSRDKIYDDGTGIVHSFGCDYSRKIFRSLADFSVGLPSHGHSCWFGAGGPYEDGVKVVTFDGGTTYVDVTDSTTIQFPNLNVGTCLYFGETNANSWYGMQYLMGTAKLAGGSIEWQYYDGGTSSWIKINTLNTINGHSDTYNGYSFIGDNGVIQTVRFDQNVDSGIIESNAAATGWTNTTIDGDSGKWMRCIITGAITTSPVFQTVRLKGHFTTIRENGTYAHNGEGRSLRNEVLTFGDSGSGGASKTLAVSSNISYPFWNNGLNDASTNELYFRFSLNEMVDTSSGLVLKYTCSTPHTGPDNKTAKIKVHSAKIKAGDSFDGANTETAQDSDFAYTANDSPNLAHTYTVAHRLDIGDMIEDDMIFIMIQRTGADGADTLTNSVDFSNVWVEYRAWQEGKCLI